MDQAIDPKTGKINWDCPCMGNNPKGPCGELFKRAFRCFVDNQDTPDKCKNFINILQKCQEKYPKFYEENN
jgi:hypothetical protein